ncbi:MFS general substrate transporter [Aspergillus campestris IBT 28561]|uniref:MFS general substrate transporter n=1 Tax=Aspergillus campestris (strain IBT 28561) TaxID=1392248 RepID=A0A2I1CQ17_ASPC2|nr:MFS general substrate transporter [Aspergillus campestris IBT 28561]PKX99724.1 MFS general substrate transporter [Aspergillus campestris IBT 28561]
MADEKARRQAFHDADEAMQAIQDLQGEAIELDEATTSCDGIKEDLSLKHDQYQWLASLFYFGYLAWEYPTSRLLQMLPLGKYSAACIIIWGSILCCFAGVTNFSAAFFLGVFEASVTPGFALLTAQQPGNIWFSFNGWGQIFGGLVAYGIAVGTRIHGSAIDPWKIVFLVTGFLTVALGLIFLWVVPDSQLNARWLKKEDRLLAIARVRVNQQGIGNKHYKKYQIVETLMDPMTWAFFFFAIIANIPNGGITNFFNQLITSFVEIVALLLSGYIGQYTGQRILCSMGGLVASIVGMVLIVALPLSNNVGRLIGYYMTQASPTPFVALLALISSNVAGYTKKTTVAALYLIGYCAGNIIAQKVPSFPPRRPPRYVPAEITLIVCWGVCLMIMAFIWWWYDRENKKKALKRAARTMSAWRTRSVGSDG